MDKLIIVPQYNFKNNKNINLLVYYIIVLCKTVIQVETNLLIYKLFIWYKYFFCKISRKKGKFMIDESTNELCYINQMPMEVLGVIESYLKKPELVSLALTCKNLMNSATDPLLWKNEAKKIPEILELDSINFLNCFLDHVKKVSQVALEKFPAIQKIPGFQANQNYLVQFDIISAVSDIALFQQINDIIDQAKNDFPLGLGDNKKKIEILGLIPSKIFDQYLFHFYDYFKDLKANFGISPDIAGIIKPDIAATIKLILIDDVLGAIISLEKIPQNNVEGIEDKKKIVEEYVKKNLANKEEIFKLLNIFIVKYV